MTWGKYSVLMSVYYKEKPEYLRISMESIYQQTVPCDEFVLVCDGPLNDGLDAVIEEMAEKFSERLRVIRLEQNSGLGKALNIGITHCRNELVARMDSDDISRPYRCEKQLEVFQENPDIAIVSGTVEEFSVSTEQIEARRVLPELHTDIINFAKKRNPFNHPCVMYKKSAVEASGGYQDFYLLEDYYLWIRMFLKGYKGYNLREPLLWMRAGTEMYKRRGGWKYVKSQRELFEFMNNSGFIRGTQYFVSLVVRCVSAFMPNGFRKYAYRILLRET